MCNTKDMRKEVLFAIITGGVIGLIIAFGAWKVSRIVTKKEKVSEVQKTPPAKNVDNLVISNLNEYDIVTDNPYLVSGITTPNSPVLVSTIEEDFYANSKSDGTFEIEVEFPAGFTEIKINDNQMLVVFSSEFKKYLNIENPTDDTKKEASDEAEISDNPVDEIREKVKEEIKNKSLKKTAYVGTITDISSGNIQIRSITGNIEQLSVTSNTSYINTLKKNIEVKKEDLAIGDYIVAMGFVNGNKVLDTKRILIASSFEKNEYESQEIEIMTLSKTKLNDITLPKSWKGPNIRDLEVGQKITIVGKNNNDKTYILRSIFTPVE